VTSPKDALLEGAKILGQMLRPTGFEFHFRGEGRGSGGSFAWGEFVRGDRRLELHFRRNLGLVSYHVGNLCATHESYMRQLGVWKERRYPGFSEEPTDAFRGLAHDLGLAEDFLTGTAANLKQAAAKEKVSVDNQNADVRAHSVGDTRKLDQMRNSFREKRYGEVVKLARGLKYPNQMTQSERKMVEIARKRTSAP